VELPLWFPRKICIPILFLFNMTLGRGVIKLLGGLDLFKFGEVFFLF